MALGRQTCVPRKTGGRAQVARSCLCPENVGTSGALELALLGDALMRLGLALDAVLLLVALRRKDAYYFEDTACPPLLAEPRHEMNALAHAEPVQRQDCLRYAETRLAARSEGACVSRSKWE